jgi:hypothetical protein
LISECPKKHHEITTGMHLTLGESERELEREKYI